MSDFIILAACRHERQSCLRDGDAYPCCSIEGFPDAEPLASFADGFDPEHRDEHGLDCVESE